MHTNDRILQYKLVYKLTFSLDIMRIVFAHCNYIKLCLAIKFYCELVYNFYVNMNITFSFNDSVCFQFLQ